nr:unnamed protein product [Digitaria exilis]
MELEGGAEYAATSGWALFLNNMRVIDLHYTDWAEILLEDKIEFMANLMELNLAGFKWPRWTSSHQMHKRLSNLQRLRIIRPNYDEAAAQTMSIWTAMGQHHPIGHQLLSYHQKCPVRSNHKLMQAIGGRRVLPRPPSYHYEDVDAWTSRSCVGFPTSWS